MLPMKQTVYLALVVLSLFLSGLACQLSGGSSSAEAPVNQATMVAEVVGSVEARLPEQTAVANQISPELEQRLVQIYDQTNPSVVHIFVYSPTGYLGSGTGFVFDEAGHVVTNNHVVEGGSSLEIEFPDGQRRYGELVGQDVDSDLAVVRVENLPSDVRPLPLGDSDELRVGQFVVAIGNPFGEASSMSVGIVSGLGRTLESQRVAMGGYFSLPQVIQTDAAINPGNSGGPLLNLDGQVVGVNSAILSRTGSNSGVGFSIPVNAVHSIVPSLIETGVYHYSYMGITMLSRPFTLRELEQLQLPPNGVWVTGVTPGSPAEQAGLIGHNLDARFTADGDYIVAIDGRAISNSDELLSYLVFETQVGDTVDLTVIRQGEELILPLILGQRP